MKQFIILNGIFGITFIHSQLIAPDIDYRFWMNDIIESLWNQSNMI